MLVMVNCWSVLLVSGYSLRILVVFPTLGKYLTIINIVRSWKSANWVLTNAMKSGIMELGGRKMAYLHYRFDTGSLKAIEDKCERRGRLLEAKLIGLYAERERFAIFGKRIPGHVRGQIQLVERNQRNNGAQYNDIYEELWWRDDADELKSVYAKRGYKLMFRCGAHEFDTEREALSEASFQHTYNDVLLDYGADGDGIDDMVNTEDMIQAFFRKEV